VPSRRGKLTQSSLVVSQDPRSRNRRVLGLRTGHGRGSLVRVASSRSRSGRTGRFARIIAAFAQIPTDPTPSCRYLIRADGSCSAVGNVRCARARLSGVREAADVQPAQDERPLVSRAASCVAAKGARSSSFNFPGQNTLGETVDRSRDRRGTWRGCLGLWHWLSHASADPAHSGPCSSFHPWWFRPPCERALNV